MKTPMILFTTAFTIAFYGCEVNHSNRLIKDKVRNVDIYTLDFKKAEKSKIHRIYKSFHIEFKKEGIRNDQIDVNIISKQQIYEPEYADLAYFLVHDQIYKYDFINISNMKIMEEEQSSKLEVINTSATELKTVTQVVPVVTETGIVHQVQTEHIPVTTNNISKNNHIKTKIAEKIYSKRKILVNGELLNKLRNKESFMLRIYDKDNDFWDIRFTKYNIAALMNFIDNQVSKYNISH